MRVLIVAISFFISQAAFSQDTLRLSLNQVVEMAKDNSIAAKQATTTRETKYWQWRTFKSNYQPQLSLSGNLPGYTKTSTPVVQPDGTILFQPVHYDNSALNLNFSQTVTATGATIYGTTQLQRFDDFNSGNVLYNGVPYAIGFTQPLGQFNLLKWDKKIQPLLYNESVQTYIEARETISIKITGYFFDLLLAQVNLATATANLANTQKILKVANLKFELGKVSKNEILQLKLELLNAKKAVGTATRDAEIATLNLRSYTGLEGNAKIVLVAPEIISQMTVSADRVLTEAFANRSDAIAFMRRVAEAQRDVALARGQTGLTATLTANLGTSNSSATIPGVYRSPQNQQLLELQFSIPVLDWGRSKAKIKTAEANQKFTEYSVEQDKQTFKQQIITQVSLFNVTKEQLAYTAQADTIASEKYKIARDRYVLGDLSITDLSIAFQENDQPNVIMCNRSGISGAPTTNCATYHYMTLNKTEKSLINNMIQLKNIEKVYRTSTVETLALNSINLEVAKGEFLSIMGPSGCGKSTLLNIMGLLDMPSKGSIIIDKQGVDHMKDKALASFRNKKLGFIFQSYHLINDLSVLDNVELPLLYRDSTAKERRRLATEALEKVGLANRMKHFPSQLSGGQRQRVAIARAIVGCPEIILADEPTGNLDSNMGNEIMDILIQLNQNEGTTIVMVTHDENMAHKTHRLVRLFDGSQVQ